MSDDNIFREVDEEMRREQLAALWDKYGIYVLAGAVLIILVAGGYNIYLWQQQKRAAEFGQAFYQANELVTERKTPEALEALTKLTKQAGHGYRTLSHLQMAAIEAEQGRKSEAVALYEKASKDVADQILRDFARLQAAALRVDEADEAEMQKRLQGLIADTNPWRYSAQELLALTAFRSGNTSESEKIYSKILGDPSAPAEIRRRAEAMLALLVKAPKQLSSAKKSSGESETQ